MAEHDIRGKNEGGAADISRRTRGAGQEFIRPEFGTLYAGLDRLVSRVPAFVWLADTNLLYRSVLGSKFLAGGDDDFDLLGRSAVDFPGDGNPNHPFVEACRRAVHGEAAESDFPFRGRLYRACLEPRLDDADGSVIGIVGVAYDVTDRLRVEELLSSEVRFDVLTGLPNRSVFQERLIVAIDGAQRLGEHFAVLFVDLDRFKAVNEALGHNIGDLFLQTVSERIRQCVGEDALLARFGGDQFVILMPTDRAGAAASALSRTIVDEFTRPIVVNAREIFATVSVGLTIAPEDGLDADRIIGNAGTALHDAKDLGGNGFRRYDSRRRDRASDRFAIETDLRRTVGADDSIASDLANEGFVLHYQPIMATVDERIVGAEALVRWNHPLRKLVPPDAFIPLAEQTGLILKIGEWVFRTALLQLRAWDEAGIRVERMAINISGRQFHHSNLVETVERLLGETGVDPNRIELELTETVVMRDVEATIVTLARLRTLGVHLSIDDFGTGYSSLAYLKRFPIDTLKIDRSFTRDTSNGAADAAIVGTIVALGHNLGKRVVAEGVETRGQIDFLRSIACDELQGFYFSRPLPYGEFAAFFRNPMHGLHQSAPRVRRRVRHFPGQRLPLAE
jgi:diguanylate cyclase (GGDEF)-like protein